MTDTNPMQLALGVTPPWFMAAATSTPETPGVLNADLFAAMPPGASLVNVGRGPHLVASDLLAALDSDRLRAAALDVADPEPLPAGHRLWRTGSVIITPHVSCDDPSSYNARSLAVLFANLRAWRGGAALPNRVDPTRGY
jgi:phosphoglycerate dehydrogenase-like enzyme